MLTKQRALGIAALVTFVIAALGGCTTGSRQLSEMSALQVHKCLELGKTSMDDVQRTFGEPQRKGVEKDSVCWIYSYQKVSGKAFIPIVNMMSKDSILRGYLFISFDDGHIVKDVHYDGSN